MRRTRTNDIAPEWIEQKSNRAGSIEGEAGRMYYRGPTIFSYGSHFPMAHLLTKDGEPFILVNADTYSSYTSKHQSSVQTAVRESGLSFGYTSFSALDAAGVDPLTITILDTTGDRDISRAYKGWTRCYREGDACPIPTNLHARRDVASGWRSGPPERNVRFHYEEGTRDIHIMGELLFKVEQVEDIYAPCFGSAYQGFTYGLKAGPDCPQPNTTHRAIRDHLRMPTGQGEHFIGRKDVTRHFISGIDETASNPWQGFFLTELVKPVTTVADALMSMAPKVVNTLRHFGAEDIIRQGEWFFIPVKTPDFQARLDTELQEKERAVRQAKRHPRLAEITKRVDEIARSTGQMQYSGIPGSITRQSDPVQWETFAEEYARLRQEEAALHREEFNRKGHRMATLPARSPGGREAHQVTRLLVHPSVYEGQEDHRFARGLVRHTHGDHRTITLGDGKQWYQVIGNQQVRSWSIGNGGRRANVD